MSTHRNFDAPAGRRSGRGNTISPRVANPNILTQTQRDAFEKYRAYKRISEEAERTQAQALDEMRKACALMRRTGLRYDRMVELTGLGMTKLRGMVECGEGLLGQ